MKKLLFAVLFSVGLPGVVWADHNLAKQIDAVVGRTSQKQVQFSIHVVKAGSGKQVYSHNAKKALVPASNMKLIATAAALKYLGPNYQYETRVGLCGDTLVIIGSGDPLLGDSATDAKYGRSRSWIFEDITAKLKRDGKNTIENIIVDSTIFDDQRVHLSWPKGELNRWYACEISGLNYNGNCIDVTAETVAGNVNLTIEPQTSYVEIINKCRPTSTPPDTVWCARPEGTNTITVMGNCHKRCRPVYVTIERPAVFLGYLLAENLQKAGIKTKGELIEKAVRTDCDFKELAVYSTPIADCLSRCNKDSFALAAEALVKTIAANVSPVKKNGTWAGGQEAISRYLRQLGIKESQFHIDDGSGLSRENKLSAHAITEVLFSVYKTKDWQLYKDSLAVGGVDGTISKYFGEEEYKGNIFGKTGYIKGVKSISGVCSSRGGDYIFSILANNTNGKTRQAINDIAKAIIDSGDK